MPELPEVEVTRQGILPHIQSQIVQFVIIRALRLRWPIPENLPNALQGQRLRSVERRAKYLLLEFELGWCVVHLGMSGTLRIFPLQQQADFSKHDHVDWIFENCVLRLRDPRRFGAVLWFEKADGDVFKQPLFQHLGVEPFSNNFSAVHLYLKSRSRKISIKQFLLEGRAVVGVGNIYASESLFRAKISPLQPANHISKKQYQRLALAIVEVLREAITKGGSSLKDFVGSDGKSGYFQQEYAVYGRTGQACYVCGTTIQQVVQATRSSFYCPVCQK